MGTDSSAKAAAFGLGPEYSLETRHCVRRTTLVGFDLALFVRRGDEGGYQAFVALFVDGFDAEDDFVDVDVGQSVRGDVADIDFALPVGRGAFADDDGVASEVGLGLGVFPLQDGVVAVPASEG